MSEAVGGVAKMCTICGTDVANKPRTKDAKGRYVCKECVERAQQAKAAKAQAEAAPVAVKAGPKSGAEVQAGDNSFLLDLAKPEIPKGKVMCPSCGKAMSEEAVICVSCGFNKTKNEKLHVQVLKPKIERERSRGLSFVNAATAPLFAIIGSAICGVIGALVWGGIAYGTGYQIGWIAIGVGALCGFGAGTGARGYTGFHISAIGAIMAVISIVGGRCFAIWLILDRLGYGGRSVLDWFPATFGVFDIVYFTLAVVAAFKVSSDM